MVRIGVHATETHDRLLYYFLPDWLIGTPDDAALVQTIISRIKWQPGVVAVDLLGTHLFVELSQPDGKAGTRVREALCELVRRAANLTCEFRVVGA